MKKRLSFVALALAGAFLALPGQASATPISGCTGSVSSLVCDLFESDASGNPSEISITAGFSVDRFFVLLEAGTVINGSNEFDTNNWSDVVHVEEAFECCRIELFSDPSLFAEFTASQIIAGIEFPTLYVVEDASGVTSFSDPFGAHFTVHSDGDASAVPEPASMVLLGSGLIGAARLRRRRRS